METPQNNVASQSQRDCGVPQNTTNVPDGETTQDLTPVYGAETASKVNAVLTSLYKEAIFAYTDDSKRQEILDNIMYLYEVIRGAGNSEGITQPRQVQRNCREGAKNVYTPVIPQLQNETVDAALNSTRVLRPQTQKSYEDTRNIRKAA